MEKEFSRGEYFIFCKTEHKQATNNLEKRKRFPPNREQTKPRETALIYLILEKIRSI